MNVSGDVYITLRVGINNLELPEGRQDSAWADQYLIEAATEEIEDAFSLGQFMDDYQIVDMELSE